MQHIGIGTNIGKSGGVNWTVYWATRTVTGVTIVVNSGTQFTVSWTNNGTTDYTGHKIYISTDDVTYTLNKTVTSIGTSTTIKGLTKNTLYYIKVAPYKNDNIGTLSIAASATSGQDLEFLPCNTDNIQCSSIGDTVGVADYTAQSEGISLLTTYKPERINQKGSLVQVQLNVITITGITECDIVIWRFDGTNYDEIAREDITDELSVANPCTVTLDTPIDVEEGDFISTYLVADVDKAFSQTADRDAAGCIYIIGTKVTGVNQSWSGVGYVTPNSSHPIAGFMKAPLIVGIGDSLIESYPLHTSMIDSNYTTVDITKSWLYKLRTSDAKFTYQNCGIGGNRMNNITGRFERDCLDKLPRFAILNGGINDLAIGTAKATVLAAWESILDDCEANDIIPVMWLLMPWTDGTNDQMQDRDDWNTDLLTLFNSYLRTDWVVINFDNDLGQFRAGGDVGNLWDIKTEYNEDDIHYNETGQAKIAEVVLREIGKVYNLSDTIPYGLRGEAISDTEIDLTVELGLDNDHDGGSWEYSTDGVNYTEYDTTAENVDNIDVTGLTENTKYWFRFRTYKGAVYSPYTNVITDYTYVAFTLASTGTGAAVATLQMSSSANQTVKVTGNAKFYSNLLGTLGESTEWKLTTGALRTIYIKNTSGTGNLLIKAQYVTGFGDISNNGFNSGINAPSLGGDISKLTTALTVLWIAGNNTLSGSVAALTGLTYFRLTGSNTISGSVAALTSLTYLSNTGTSNAMTGSIAALTSLTYLSLAGNTTISGSVAALTSLTYLSVTGTNTITGSVALLTSLGTLNVLGSNTLSGSIANLSSLILLYCTGSNTLTGSNALLTLAAYTRVTGSNTISYGTHIWPASTSYFYISAQPGSGWSIANISQAIIDASAATWAGTVFNLADADHSSMADTNQGGIWGDFDGETSPSALATAYKTLMRTKSVVVQLVGIVAPGGSGDGTGFPAGFGDWYRS